MFIKVFGVKEFIAGLLFFLCVFIFSMLWGRLNLESYFQALVQN